MTLEAHYGHLVRILHCCIDQTMTDALNKMDLTASQGRLMAFVYCRGTQPTYAKDVEAALHLTHPTVSGLLFRLEQKGFLELKINPNDRRSRQIVISQKGNACFGAMRSLISENEDRIVRGFSPQEQVQFRSFLQRAIENIRPENGQKEESGV